MKVDWHGVFDESHPEPGASPAEVALLVSEIARSLSGTEIEEIHRGQCNPFGAGDSLHAHYRPFDATSWSFPTWPLPDSYLSFLQHSNGGEFVTGERRFQFFPALDARHGVRAMLLAYHVPQYMPGALPFALNGGGIFYMFDMRQPSATHEYPIVCAEAGNLEWDQDACWQIAHTFADACTDMREIESLRPGR